MALFGQAGRDFVCASHQAKFWQIKIGPETQHGEVEKSSRFAVVALIMRPRQSIS